MLLDHFKTTRMLTGKTTDESISDFMKEYEVRVFATLILLI